MNASTSGSASFISLASFGIDGRNWSATLRHCSLAAWSCAKAVAKVLTASWQRCRVHFMRNALAYAGKNGRRVVSAFIANAGMALRQAHHLHG